MRKIAQWIGILVDCDFKFKYFSSNKKTGQYELDTAKMEK